MSVSRFPWDLQPTDFARQEASARDDAEALVDLTGSNPTRVGLGAPASAFTPIASASLTAYHPDPQGSLLARQAVARYLAAHGSTLGPEAIVLSASSSEAYSWLFKVLAEPGAAVAIPEPSYPLFDFLTHLEGIRPLAYDLVHTSRGWRVDQDSLEACLEAGARAVVVVQPSNPVGACLCAKERRALFEACARSGAAVICDEVFLDYGPAPPETGATSLASEAACAEARQAGVPLFVLSGASKVVCAPQLKLGWIALAGAVSPEQRSRLELVADTFLSVSCAAQAWLPGLLEARGPLQARVRARLATNRQALAAAIQPRPSLALRSQPAGWSAVLRLPTPAPLGLQESWAEHLLRVRQVLVHPGYFYELPEQDLVLSLLGDPEAFATGVERIVLELDTVEAR